MPSSDHCPILSVTYHLTDSLTPNPRNARTHSKRQIKQIADSIAAFGFDNPIIIDETGMVLAGHGRLAAAKLLGLGQVPAVEIRHLNETQKRAYVLADNKLAEKAGWDRATLAIELGELAVLLPELEFDLTLTGFEAGELDQINADHDGTLVKAEDQLPELPRELVSRRGDLWLLGSHRVLCGDTRSNGDVQRLMQGETARLMFTDPPYNVRIGGHVQGRGKVQHEEFAFASGEMSSAEFTSFLTTTLGNLARACRDGAISFVCMDWRHLRDLQQAGDAVFTQLKNLIVWNKTSPGQGSFYRSQHELILAYKVGTAEHINSFGLGSYGRTRSNVWTYPGANSFRSNRAAELAWHPTVKPVALVADAIRDCSLKHDIVLDGFLGSGSTLIAAEKVGRRCYGLEYEPKYVDVIIRRWQGQTKLEAVLEGDGRSFDEVKAERIASVPDGAEASIREDMA